MRLLSKARPRRAPEDRERNTYGLPAGEPIRKALVTSFRAQRVQMLAALGVRREKWARWILTKNADTWDPNSFEFPSFELGALAMSERMTPLITALWDKAGQQFTSKVKLDPDRWEVTNPHTERMIRDASLEFCKATNETTSLNLAEALKRTRQELVEGIVQRGESLERLTKRVQTIFDSAETWRARRIAATESSRAVHSAQEEAAKQSGVVAGWEWLLSDDACPLCHTVARRAKQVRLGQAFAVVGDHPVYSEIRFPPLHPSCQCTVIEVLKPEYGGPENPQWAETLQQLKPTEEDGASPPRKPAGADAFSQGAGSTNPPPLPPLIQQSVDWWRKRKIKAEPRGYQNIVQYSSVSHADTVVASYDPNDRTVYVNENHPYWSDPNYIQQAHFLGESSTDDPLHVAYHEGAHALHHRKIGDAGYRALDRNPLTGDELVAARFVSEYAKTGEPEFVAEVYAGLVAGRSYNQDVMKVYRKLGGPKPPRRRGNP